MYNCVIVDDEPLARKVLKFYIEKTNDFELFKECRNVNELKDALSECSVDLIFLDIEMPGIKGIDFINSYEKPLNVILTTAHRDYAVEAFNLDVVDYLVKPIEYERFLSSIDRYKKNPLQNVKSNPQLDDYLTVYIKRSAYKIYCKEIIYIESMKDYILIYTKNNTYKIKNTLKSILKELGNSFTQIHRSYIINRHYIEAYNQKFVLLKENYKIPIGRKYKSNIYP